MSSCACTWSILYMYMKYIVHVHEVVVYMYMKYIVHVHCTSCTWKWSTLYMYMKYIVHVHEVMYMYMKYIVHVHEVVYIYMCIFSLSVTCTCIYCTHLFVILTCFIFSRFHLTLHHLKPQRLVPILRASLSVNLRQAIILHQVCLVSIKILGMDQVIDTRMKRKQVSKY